MKQNLKFIYTLSLFCALLGPLCAQARPLDLKTSDDVRIHAEMTGRGSHGVLLVHDRDRSGVVWKLFADKLAQKGFRILTIDLRGHGKSDKPDGELNYNDMIQDVQAGLKTLQRYQLSGLSIIGADLGANLTLAAAVNDPKVTNIVMLSPGFNIKGLKVTANLTAYGSRPVLLAAGIGDDYANKTATFLKSKAAGPSQLVQLKGAENGSTLLEEHPNLEDVIVQWLRGNYGENIAADGSEAIRTGDVEKMESTGKSFGE